MRRTLNRQRAGYIRKAYAKGTRVVEIAERWNITVRNCYKVIANETYRDESYQKPVRPDITPYVKILKHMRDRGESLPALSRFLFSQNCEVTESTIRRHLKAEG